MRVDIRKLLLLEAELKNPGENATSSVDQDAKVNMLKHLQIQTVLQFQEAYDALYYKLNKGGGLECVHSIAAVRSTDVLQPKILELQNCDTDSLFDKMLQFYLAEAKLAKQRLDTLVMKAVEKDSGRYEVQFAEVKSRASTERKVNSSCGGDIRRVTDMARVTLICDTPEALKEAYLAIVGLLQGNVVRVKNGFNSDWMPSGYRDVKVNPVVNDHLCEIQLHLREFYALKRGQHAVYEWARDLNVTTEMRPSDLFKNVSREVTEQMIRLAGENWQGTGFCLSDLQLAAGQYAQAEMGVQQELREAEDLRRGVEDDDSQGSRRALIRVATAKERLASVLNEQARLPIKAEPLYAQIQAVKEKYLGSEHPRLARTLNNWAGFLESQAKYSEADSLYVRAISIVEAAMGLHHPELAAMLANRAGLFQSQGKYDEADSLYERSQAIRESLLGSEHLDVARVLNSRGRLCYTLGKFAQAESLYIRALEIGEKTLGSGHPELSSWLDNRGSLLESQGKIAEANTLYASSQAVREETLGPLHPDVAHSLNNRAILLKNQGKFAEADLLYGQAIEIEENALGPDHPSLAVSLNNLAESLRAQGKYAEAERLFERSQTIQENVLGPTHILLAATLNNRAGLFSTQGKYGKAQPLFERVLAINTATLGSDHPSTITSRAWMAELYPNQGFPDKASPLLEEIVRTRERVQGPEHPDVAVALRNHARFLESQGKHDEARPLYERSFAIREKVDGPDDHETAIGLDSRAQLLSKQGEYAEADALHLQALKILSATVGEEHPDYASALINRASTLAGQGDLDDAKDLYERAHVIREKVLGPDHPDVAQSLHNWAWVLGRQVRGNNFSRKALAVLYGYVRNAKHPQAFFQFRVGRPNTPGRFTCPCACLPFQRSRCYMLCVALAASSSPSCVETQGKYEEAGPLYERAFAIVDKALGPDHPVVATILNSRTELELSRVQGKLGEFDIERVLPSDHPRKDSLVHIILARLMCAQMQHHANES
ncbi:unnamed protein product [Ectocarpus fasciculatus]